MLRCENLKWIFRTFFMIKIRKIDFQEEKNSLWENKDMLKHCQINFPDFDNPNFSYQFKFLKER